MVISWYEKKKMELDIFNLLKFGITEREGTPLLD
jgi:hypothetical protein